MRPPLRVCYAGAMQVWQFESWPTLILKLRRDWTRRKQFQSTRAPCFEIKSRCDPFKASMDPFQGNCWLADLYGLRTYRLSDLGACGLTVQYTTVDCWIFVWLKLFCWRCAKINQVNPNMIPEKISKNDFVVLPSQRHDQRRLHRHVKMKINPS